MNILKRELRANLKSLIIWCICMVFLILVGMVKYSGFAEAGQGINQIFEQLPPAMKSIFGLTDIDVTSIRGFYVMFYLYFMLLAGIHAVMLGSVIMSKEERDKTAEFLFVKPVLRNKIVTSKFLATLINLIVLNLITLLASIVFVDMFNKGAPITESILKLMGSLFILQLLFASLGAGIAAITKNTKKATSLSTTILLTTFIISVAIDLYDKIEFLKYVTPFKYFPAKEIIKTGIYEPTFLLLSFLLTIAFIVTTYIFIQRRDIHV